MLVVDDGMVTGSTTRAAVAGLRELGPRRIVVAVPVATHEAHAALGAEVDDIGLDRWYDDFTRVGDAEARALLAARAQRG